MNEIERSRNIEKLRLAALDVAYLVSHTDDRDILRLAVGHVAALEATDQLGKAVTKLQTELDILFKWTTEAREAANMEMES